MWVANSVLLVLGALILLASLFLPMTAPDSDTLNMGLIADRQIAFGLGALLFVLGWLGMGLERIRQKLHRD